MNKALNQLVVEALKAGKAKGLNQKAIAELSPLDEVGLSRLKKADDAMFTTLQELGKAVGKKLIWVNDTDDLASRVHNGTVFDFK